MGFEHFPGAPIDTVFIVMAALLAGFIDSIVGGGGLVLLPALFSVFPQAAPATLLGTNKGASVWGTSFATWSYARKVEMPWRALLPAAALALVGSFLGAWAVTQVDPAGLRLALPFILLVVLIYTLTNKNMGREHRPHVDPATLRLRACVLGAVIGFYDGFFGPGTGSFFIFGFVRWLGFDFLYASASAKFLNVMTNLAAISLFALKGHIWWHLALMMGLANMVGSILGTRLALKHGAVFVRWMFLGVVSALIAKTAWDGLRPFLFIIG
jgi:uncharacterized protein